MTNLQDIFGEPISTYTDEQALADGLLHHLWSERWPWLLITDMIFTRAEQVAFTRNADIQTVLVPLVLDAIMETQRQIRIKSDIDLVELEQTAVGTVWIRPNGKGGLTITDPGDN